MTEIVNIATAGGNLSKNVLNLNLPLNKGK